jgi:hypothetical protein
MLLHLDRLSHWPFAAFFYGLYQSLWSCFFFDTVFMVMLLFLLNMLLDSKEYKGSVEEISEDQGEREE